MDAEFAKLLFSGVSGGGVTAVFAYLFYTRGEKIRDKLDTVNQERITALGVDLKEARAEFKAERQELQKQITQLQEDRVDRAAVRSDDAIKSMQELVEALQMLVAEKSCKRK